MSRIGKLPIKIPAGTEVNLKDGVIMIKGPKGELKRKLNEFITVSIKDGEIIVGITSPDDKKIRALWGLYRSLIANMVLGVNQNFEKKLEINGVGYRASVSGSKLIMNLGFSHPVEFAIPENVKVGVEGNVITMAGIDKEIVGETAARLRKIKPPEPYKGKGIKYVDEVIRRKVGKAAAKGAEK